MPPKKDTKGAASKGAKGGKSGDDGGDKGVFPPKPETLS